MLWFLHKAREKKATPLILSFHDLAISLTTNAKARTIKTMQKIDVISAYVSEMYSRVNVCSCKCVNLIINVMCRKQTGCFAVSHVYVGRLSCCFVKMPNLTNHVRSMIIGMNQAGMKQKDIAQRLNIHWHTVMNTIRIFRLTGSTSELFRSCRRRMTSTFECPTLGITLQELLYGSKSTMYWKTNFSSTIRNHLKGLHILTACNQSEPNR